MLHRAQDQQRNPGRSKAGRSAATATGHGSEPATSPTVPSAHLVRGAAAKRFEKAVDDEEEKRQAHLRRCPSEQEEAEMKQEWQEWHDSMQVSTSARGHEEQADSAAERVAKNDEEERRAQHQPQKCLEVADYTGAAAVQEEMRQGVLRTAQDSLKKYLEHEDYAGAAFEKEVIAALVGAEPRAPPHGRSPIC